ncbi:unnamed protein product [Spirodela intermedia]|uniref:Uncharacterized protein n=1 Tax=Spirodela intermedia TaxID=51605 RepID=A0A7I8JUH0_SPIIN|nr:unnamed protein product [Spirodela intermedia]CAA6673840.1 unnamed protein product [Spirodela intermedia]
MEALMASYGSDSDSDDASPEVRLRRSHRWPPPPVDLLDLRSSIGKHVKRPLLLCIDP